MKDKQRAEFERWINQCNNAGKRDYVDLSMTTNGLHYLEPETDLLWQAWQAALSSVVVELPESYGIGEVYLPAMLRALDEAGIRYE